MIPDRLSKMASITSGAFSLLVTAVQFLDLTTPTRFIVGGGTALTAAAALQLLRRSRRYENALRWQNELGRQEGIRQENLHFIPATREAAFAEICRTSASIYGDDNVAFDRVLSWWRQFPQGAFAVYHYAVGAPPDLAGYLSIWPLKKSTYIKLRKGRCREREISHRSINGISSTLKRQYWYVSNIVMAKRYRHGPLLRLLLEKGLQYWAENGNLEEQVSVLAFAYSNKGAALLRKFGFLELSGTSPDGWPIYEFESPTASITERVQSVLSVASEAT